MLSLILIFVSSWSAITFSNLIEPIKIEILPGISYDFSIDYCVFSVPPYITSMNALCYCFFDPDTETSFNCSIPGPTFIFHPGHTISWTWHNRMKGDSVSTFLNQQRDLDITNIHTHGMHISPDEDNVLVRILPGTGYTYSYSITPDHYPGTHWLHAHHHGSVSFQVVSGLFSASLIEYSDRNDLGDDSLISMKENVLIFHWIYVITTDICNCTNTDQWRSYFYHPPTFEIDNCVSGRDCFRVFSYCYEYCSMPQRQRIISGFTYNIQSDYLNNFQIFLINGQHQPTIDDIKLNTFRRLRFVNAITQYYIQYKFPTESCHWYIIAIDGIYLTATRSINDVPYLGEYLLPSGGRLDVIVKCSVVGDYHILATESNARDPELWHIGRVPGDLKLFSIHVSDNGIDTVSSVPLSFPPRPHYLTDLRASITAECACNTYFDPDIDNGRMVTWTERECGYVFNMQNRHNINGVEFNLKPMTSLEYGKVYEFTLIPHMHPYHQHINPFQVQHDVGVDGFQAKAGDWFDTLGGGKFTQIKFRTYPIDFTGMQIVHCHFLPHEDVGMMTLMNILQPNQTSCDTSNPTTTAPTNAPSIPRIVTLYPSNDPTVVPSNNPSNHPSNVPSINPSTNPSNVPSKVPTIVPSNSPTKSPSISPSIRARRTPKPRKPKKGITIV